MYSHSLQELNSFVLELVKGQVLSCEQELPLQGALNELLQSICPGCSQGE